MQAKVNGSKNDGLMKMMVQEEEEKKKWWAEGDSNS